MLSDCEISVMWYMPCGAVPKRCAGSERAAFGDLAGLFEQRPCTLGSLFKTHNCVAALQTSGAVTITLATVSDHVEHMLFIKTDEITQTVLESPGAHMRPPEHSI